MARDDEEDVATFKGVSCTRETDDAILCLMPNGAEVWFPKSTVHDDSEVFDEDENSEGTLVVLAFIARKKGLIE